MSASASATPAAITTISAHRVASSRYTAKNASPAAYGGSRLAVRARSQQLPHREQGQVEGRARDHLGRVRQERVDEIACDRRGRRQRGRGGKGPAAMRALEERGPEERLGREHVGAKIVGPPGDELDRPARVAPDARASATRSRAGGRRGRVRRAPRRPPRRRSAAAPAPIQPGRRHASHAGQRQICEPAARQRLRRTARRPPSSSAASSGACRSRGSPVDVQASATPSSVPWRPPSRRFRGPHRGTRPSTDRMIDAGDAERERRDRSPRRVVEQCALPTDERVLEGVHGLASRGAGVEPEEPEQRGHRRPRRASGRPRSMRCATAHVSRQGGAVRAVRGERVVDVGDGDDARAERNRVTGEPVRVAACRSSARDGAG